MIIEASSHTLYCAAPQGDQAKPFVYLPAGVHTIDATQDGAPKTVTVSVDETCLPALQAALDRRLNGTVRPHIDFDHKGAGPAAGHPARFEWQDGVGVVCAGDWTGAGRTALRDRDYSYFSPTFSVDKTGRPDGLPKTGAIGSLVNEPAFREIGKLAAKHNTNTNTMDLTKLIAAGILAADATPETAPALICAAFNELTETQTNTADALTKLQGVVEAANKKAADETIERLVKAGHVTAANKELAHKTILADPASVALFEASTTGDVTQSPLQAGHSAPKNEPQDDPAKASRVLQAAQAIVANESVPFSVAWNRAQSVA